MIQKLKLKSEFSRNVLTLMTGTTIAQAIPIAISPILTRIYTPEDFGVFALYISISSIIIAIATGRYELAIVLPKKDDDALNIVALSLGISVLMSLVSFIIVFIFNEEIVSLLNNPDISFWLYFIPLSVLLTGFYQSFFYWNNRKKEYKKLSASQMIRSSTTAASNLGLGYTGYGSGGLILSSIFGQGLATVYIGKIFFNENRQFVDKINKLRILALAKKYIKFPKFNTQHALFNTLFSQIPIFILSSFFTSAAVGFYSLSIRVVRTPVLILGSSIATVLYEKITNLKNKSKKYMNSIYKFIMLQFILSIILFTVIYFVSFYFHIIFGEKWDEVGAYIRALIPWLFMVFWVSPLAFSINLTNNQEKGLALEWLYGIVKFGSLMIGVVFFKDILITLKIFSISSAIFLCFQGLWFISLLKEVEKDKDLNYGKV